MRCVLQKSECTRAESITARDDSISTGECVLHMPEFPALWAWSTKLGQSTKKWTPISSAYPLRQLPTEMRFVGSHWLCAPQHLDASVRQEFAGPEGGPPLLPSRVSVLCITSKDADEVHLLKRLLP
jgi:hypothetical protein